MDWIKREFKLSDDQFSKLTDYFQTTDSFNPENTLEGYICKAADSRYGALAITKINDEETEQIIWATPKLKYPFDKNGDFYDINPIRAFSYEKLDGTNILSYWYEYNGKSYNTFKTRLNPIVSKNTFGDFLSLWNEARENNKWIDDIINMNKHYHLSFEMYGWRNPLTIKYDVPIDVALLFGVNRENHKIVPPSELTAYKKTKLPKVYKFNTNSDFEKEYKNTQKEQSEINNTSTKEDEYFTEGNVIYSQHSNGEWRMYKCKPEEIQKIHWGNSAIPFESIFVTAINLFETYDSPNIKNLKDWLLEDYTEAQVDLSEDRINKALNKAYEHMILISNINNAYSMAKEKGFDISKDKSETMRFLSQFFEKKDMRKVATYLLNRI